MPLRLLHAKKPNWAFLFPISLVLTTGFLVVIAVLNDFYVLGDMGDIGWFSSAAWHNNIFLEGPPTHAFSFFNVHIAPILWLTNLVSYITPLSKIDYWAALCAIIYVGYALGIYQLWLSLQPRDAAKQPVFIAKSVAWGVALAATFSAIGVQALRLPHLEMGIPALSLWFFFALSQKKFRLAFLPFTLCLMIREDAGFHLFGLLLLTGITLRICRRQSSLERPIFLFALAALLYALIALILKSRFFMAMDNMTIVYAGNPSWSHLNWDLVGKRLLFFVTERTFISLPFLMAIIWAFYVRNPLLVLGYVAAPRLVKICQSA